MRRRVESASEQEVREQAKQEAAVRASWYRIKVLPLAGSEHGEEILVALIANAQLDS